MVDLIEPTLVESLCDTGSTDRMDLLQVQRGQPEVLDYAPPYHADKEPLVDTFLAFLCLLLNQSNHFQPNKVCVDEAEFCAKSAKAAEAAYNEFLKTL